MPYGDCSMRSIALAFLLILYTLGCAGPGTSSKNHGIESQTHTCLSLSSMGMETAASPSCRPEPPLLEKVGNALGGFAAAMRDPNQ